MPDYPHSLGRLLNFSTIASNQMCNSLLAEHGLSLAQWVMLSALWRENGMLISELANYTGNAIAATSRIIDRMEKHGLVKREMDKNDRRAVRVYLTDKSTQLNGLIDFYQTVNQHLMEGFSDDEQQQLFDFLQRLIDNAHKAQV